MNTDQLILLLDDPTAADGWLNRLGLQDHARAHQNLVNLADAGITLDLLAIVCGQIEDHLPGVSDPDMALNNLERLFLASRTPLSLASLIERDPEALPILLQILASSQYLADMLVRDPAAFDLVRLTDGKPVTRQVLIDEICASVAALESEADVVQALREHKQRETLRIAFGDIIRRQPVHTVTQQISFVADALVEAAVLSARRFGAAKRGVPLRPNGHPARFVVLAMGKLGGVELNYSSDIDLIFLCDSDGKTDHQRSVANQEFFERMARQVVKLLAENTGLGIAYRVDMRLRPEGKQGPLVSDSRAALRYYDVSGRTWERQAFVKARPIAGDLELGREFLEQLQDWVYRRYLSRADITGIKALKRRIEHRAESGDDNVKTGHGGIRDIEFVIQFLQLLNGGDLPNIRTVNTLDAVARLEEARCLTMQERTILEENYAFLRKIEHRLQIMFDLQTHSLPDSTDEMKRLALRMGYANNGESALTQFQRDLNEKTALNRKMLDHLLHDAFSDDTEADPETDLILDPEPSDHEIETVLRPYGFANTQSAYENLMALSSEKIPFLSTRRCRHFLAAIAAELLSSIATTPDPDSTLINLANISDSVGGKGVLWELFSFHPPSLQLYVRLCASSSYLSGILTSNPGMIDELMDSMMLDKLPTLESLERNLNDLCRGAEDLDPIIHSFKNSQHLRVGVRDILGKEDIKRTHRALSDIAEVVLNQIARREYLRLVRKYGHPTIREGTRAGEWCSPIIVAMGKLGGREPNYHSDLDVVFLYEADGVTQPAQRAKGESTSNQHFFNQLAQRIIKIVNQLGPWGRLYEVDARLRPTGKSGAMVMNLAEFSRYFEEGQGQLWERQALCKARIIHATEEARAATQQTIQGILTGINWSRQRAGEIRQMRYRLEETASQSNLKRGPGGTVDIEFAIQMLQLKHAASHPGVVKPGTLDAIAALAEQGLVDRNEADQLRDAYRFLRTVESRIRLMNATARHDIPQNDKELKGLAFLLGYPNTDALVAACRQVTTQVRALFETLFARES